MSGEPLGSTMLNKIGAELMLFLHFCFVVFAVARLRMTGVVSDFGRR